jgi:hypothetical protein
MLNGQTDGIPFIVTLRQEASTAVSAGYKGSPGCNPERENGG